jgi:uridine kinase
MKSQITVRFINGESRKYQRDTSLLNIMQDMRELYTTPVVAAKVNNEIRDLRYKLTEDCQVDFLDLHTDPGIKIYQRSLTFLLIAAAQELFPEGDLTVEHSLSKGLYCELHLGHPLTKADVAALEARMRQIVMENRPIVRKNMPKAEAIDLFLATGQNEKIKLLKQMKRDNVKLYYCGAAYGYMYGTMTPTTSELKLFELVYYEPGLILRFPEKDEPEKLPPFVYQPKLAQIFAEAERWGQILHCGYVATLNECIENKSIGDIIRVAEALHEKKIAQIADFVLEHSNVRLILIAGPSSSGKTTFAHRLDIQLRVNGLRPMSISLDDYFVDRVHTPRDENGDYDFESIEAIDLALFNDHLTKILKGEEVSLPTFNFKTGKREFRGNKIKIDNEQPLIIEGIHGLNERLTNAIPRELKVKIYISALTQLSIDNHNRIPTTDARLIRRIVRDSQFRSHDALRTLEMWASVRRGEERNIFPFQEEADIMFNSALIYELAVLKKYAEPLLEKVTSESPQRAEAQRLLKFLSYFHSVPDKDIPQNSILREFVGESCFYE